jgi:hypothetical protein
MHAYIHTFKHVQNCLTFVASVESDLLSLSTGVCPAAAVQVGTEVLNAAEPNELNASAAASTGALQCTYIQ